MSILYFVTMEEGVYEIVRVDGAQQVVQTNIRTIEKAIQACNDWQQREAERGRENERT